MGKETRSSAVAVLGGAMLRCRSAVRVSTNPRPVTGRCHIPSGALEVTQVKHSRPLSERLPCRLALALFTNLTSVYTGRFSRSGSCNHDLGPRGPGRTGPGGAPSYASALRARTLTLHPLSCSSSLPLGCASLNSRVIFRSRTNGDVQS